MWSSFFRWKRRGPTSESISDSLVQFTQVDDPSLASEPRTDTPLEIARTYKPSPAPSMVWITTGGCRVPPCACVEGNFQAESGNVASLVCRNSYCSHLFSKHTTDDAPKPEYTPKENKNEIKIPDCMSFTFRFKAFVSPLTCK